jgi:hypothetical protein
MSDDISPNYYDLWPLASLMGEQVALASVTQVAERIAVAPLPQAERSELTGLLVVLADLRLRAAKCSMR